jgi:hypothetical protein
MSAVVTYAAAVCAAVAAWLVRGALAVQTAAPGAPRVGILPPWWELPLFVLAGASAVFLLRPRRRTVMPLFITVLCVLPWMPGVDAPWLLVWTGPLSAAVLIAAIVATALVAAGDWHIVWFGDSTRASVLTAGVLALLFFSTIAFGARSMVPGGDEPHYLIITQSVLYDGDLKIENNHDRRDYAPYFAGTLRPDYLVRGKNGQIYSIHAPGLSLLIAPAFVAGGYTGVVVFLLVVAAAGIGLVWRVAFDLTGRASAAWYGTAALAAATPIAFHTFTIYPDGPAGILVLSGVWLLIRRDVTSRALVWHGVALALLPWLHTRFAILAGSIALFVLLRLPRTRDGLARAMAFLAVPAVSAAAWFAHFWVIYGTPDPEAPYGEFINQQGSWSYVTGGIAGVLFDQQFGLSPYAPVYLVAFAGWLVMLRRHRRLAIELAIIAIPYMMATAHIRMWWGGWSAPARFQVPILWLGGLGAAVAWAASRTRAARTTSHGALLVSALTTLTLAYVEGGRRAYNVRDGYSLWLEWLSPLGDLPLGLPSFFRWHGVEWALDLQILFALAFFISAFALLRVVDVRARPSGGSLALIAMSMYAAAGMGTLVLLWRVNDATGLRPAAAQIDLLRAAAAERRIAVDYSSGVRAIAPDDAVRLLRIESPPRMLGGTEPPALVLPGWIPGGVYQLELERAGGGPAPYEVRVLRTEPPILTGDAAADPAPTLRAPLDVPAIIARGPNLAASSLRPQHVFTRREVDPGGRARGARRYGDTVIWYLDGDAFNEPEGFWVRGAADSEVIVQPDARGGSAVTLLVRNGGAPNEVTLELVEGGWREALSLSPGQERELSVPIDPRRGRAALRIRSASGFRPADVDAGSKDTRYLGVWIAVR